MFQFFKDNDTRAFAHNKTASFFIKGARCLFRFLIIAGQCLHVIKASDGHFSNGSLTAPGKHDIGITVLNGAQGITNAVGPCCASRNDGRIRSFKAKGNGNLGGRHIGNFHRDEERTDAAWTLFSVLHGHINKSLHTADTGANADTDALGIFVLELEP